MISRIVLIAAMGLIACRTSAEPVSEPTLDVGQCATARVASAGSRLEGEPDSGTNIMLTNGISSLSYETNAQAALARVGDHVIACLISRRDDCPKGDTRGRVYTVVDLRTLGSWTLPNDEHSCGGT